MKFEYLYTNKKNIKFIILLAFLGFLSGIVLFNMQNINFQNTIINKISELPQVLNNTRQNNILFHLSILSIISLLSILLIGLPVIVGYYFYEFLSLGFFLRALYAYKKIKGLLFGSIFIIFNKILFLIVLSYMLLSIINYSKRFIKDFKVSKNSLIVNHLYKLFFCIVTVLLIDAILYFFGNKLLLIFDFLLK